MRMASNKIIKPSMLNKLNNGVIIRIFFTKLRQISEKTKEVLI